MEFYDVINKRRTIRDFTDEPVDVEAIKRIISAGLKAPTNDHMRNWEFVVLTDKAIITQAISKIPKKVSGKRVDFILKTWRLTDECQQKMYIDAIPKQYEMLLQSSCLVLPFFKQKANLMEPKNLSSLNAFASIWCCIENILLAAAAEGLAGAIRIPSGDEPIHIAEVLKIPKEYVLPCYVAIGHPSDHAVVNAQKDCNVESKIHFNAWGKGIAE